jgi:hypothetical protein
VSDHLTQQHAEPEDETDRRARSFDRSSRATDRATRLEARILVIPPHLRGAKSQPPTHNSTVHGVGIQGSGGMTVGNGM